MLRQDAYQLVISKVRELEEYANAVRNSNTKFNAKVKTKIKTKALDIAILIENL